MTKRIKEMATDSTSSDPILIRSDGDEFLNSITHGTGMVLSLVGAIALYLATQSSDIWIRIAVMLYVASLVAVYLLSTLSHAVRSSASKNRLRAWDQGTIYFLIVGTYTPFIAADMPRQQSIAFAAALWLVAGLGFWTKVVAKHRINAFSSWSYLALGWIPAMVLIQYLPWGCVVWMALGGISYTVGVAFLLLEKHFSFFHAIWHTLVLIASACHYYAVVAYVAS